MSLARLIEELEDAGNRLILENNEEIKSLGRRSLELASDFRAFRSNLFAAKTEKERITF